MKICVKKKMSAMIVGAALLLTACDDEAVQFKNVEEEQTTTENVQNDKKPTLDEGKETLNGVDKGVVWSYIDDSHFYDESEGVDYIQTTGEDYHIKINKAYIADLSEGEKKKYDKRASMSVDETVDYLKRQFDLKEDDIAYLNVEVEITYKGKQDAELSVGNYDVFSRVKDDRLKEYGFADKHADASVMLFSENWYDYENKKKESGMGGYVDVKPGDKISTTILFLIDKNRKDEDLYFMAHLDNTPIDESLGASLPPTSSNTKFLKLHITSDN